MSSSSSSSSPLVEPGQVVATGFIIGTALVVIVSFVRIGYRMWYAISDEDTPSSIPSGVTRGKSVPHRKVIPASATRPRAHSKSAAAASTAVYYLHVSPFRVRSGKARSHEALVKQVAAYTASDDADSSAGVQAAPPKDIRAGVRAVLTDVPHDTSVVCSGALASHVRRLWRTHARRDDLAHSSFAPDATAASSSSTSSSTAAAAAANDAGARDDSTKTAN